MLVDRSQDRDPRDECPVALGRHPGVKARRERRVRGERVVQHTLHRYDRGISDRVPGCRCSPPPPHNYVEEGGQLHPTEVNPHISLVCAPLYFGLCAMRSLRRACARSAILPPATASSCGDERLKATAGSGWDRRKALIAAIGANRSATKRYWPAGRIERPSRLARRPMPTVDRRAPR